MTSPFKIRETDLSNVLSRLSRSPGCWWGHLESDSMVSGGGSRNPGQPQGKSRSLPHSRAIPFGTALGVPLQRVCELGSSSASLQNYHIKRKLTVITDLGWVLLQPPCWRDFCLAYEQKNKVHERRKVRATAHVEVCHVHSWIIRRWIAFIFSQGKQTKKPKSPQFSLLEFEKKHFQPSFAIPLPCPCDTGAAHTAARVTWNRWDGISKPRNTPHHRNLRTFCTWFEGFTANERNRRTSRTKMEILSIAKILESSGDNTGLLQTRPGCVCAHTCAAAAHWYPLSSKQNQGAFGFKQPAIFITKTPFCLAVSLQ